MNKKQPLVSIIIPVYNGSNYLREAIDSALKQTYKNIEIIVVNDGSNDDTEDIALSYGDKIKYIKKINGGVSSALNIGIANMKGEYFSWLSHDDMYSCDKVACQIEALHKCKTDVQPLVYCNSHQIDKYGKRLTGAKNNKYLSLNDCNSWQKSLDALVKSGCFNGCSFLIHRNVFQNVGEFDTNLRYSQDFLMWSKIFLNKYTILYIENDCVMSRVHEKQLTQNGKLIFHDDSEKVAKLLFPDLVENSSPNHNFLYVYTKYFAKYDCRKAVRYCLKNGRFNLKQLFSIKMLSFYGVIRPVLRNIYYKLFKGIGTK